VVGLCTGCVFFFLCFLRICVLVLYLLVVRAAALMGVCASLAACLCFLVCLCLLCFEANKYDNDDDETGGVGQSKKVLSLFELCGMDHNRRINARL